jgi:predicted small secreted protein
VIGEAKFARGELHSERNVDVQAQERLFVLMEFCMSRSVASPLIALALLAGSMSLAACNTVEGVGEDVTATGQAIEETAEETNDGNPNTP